MTNTQYLITGGVPLHGHLFVQGSKNSILPMIAAALTVRDGQTIIRNVPELDDILTAIEICNRVGAQARYFPSQQLVTIDASKVTRHEIPPELSCKLRASVLFLAPVLARLGRVYLPSVGGCCIGSRAIDFHHRGFVRLGAQALEDERGGFGYEVERMVGGQLYLDLPSHTGTENLMLAACFADGVTVIENAAGDPEVVDFGRFLLGMGAKIKGLGTRTVLIKGVKRLKPVDYTTMPDRIDAGTFIAAVGAAQGKITIVGAVLNHLRIVIAKYRQMGLEIRQDGSLIHVSCAQRLRPINIITCPYPGFPTDLQPLLVSLATVADGVSYIRENIFEDRFSQAQWLNLMGAQVSVKNERLAVVEGVERLHGALIHADNIRAGAGLVVAALAATGDSVLTGIEQITRGYAQFVERLSSLGAILKVDESRPATASSADSADQTACESR